MLGLQLPTDPRWVNIVEKNIEEILTDHAYCEQKAATNAITMIVKFPEYTELVSALLEIAKEELEHFEMVHNHLKSRGFVLGKERKDEYVGDLMKYIQTGGNKTQQLVDKLLFSAMIEARSCERFRLLSEEINDKELRSFYHELMVSEATHYTTFLSFARQIGGKEAVDKKWQDFLIEEAKIIAKYGKKETMHG